ncbi:MAG: AbrB/MazE/SpoVT family DNA-binding domain-containing protein [Chloroflexi bacterium]|nr:AbrB/MazE/SpoVT family DNA-binding domain-containing protein [Candidatus Atribacteria bacterium]MCX6038220.1 AbrB/MazE/SpoVT family DNA-binding domain-containing protein [Chloroflexota bacterium]
MVLQIRSNGQITLPTAVRRKANLKEGDLLVAAVEEDGSIRLTPQVTIDRSQAYFWTPRWQAGEREADEDIKAGRVKEFANIDEAINYLNNHDRQE